MTSVFISYSRTDRDFVMLLRTELERTHHDAWVDLEDIPPSADWEREIYAGIDGADSFVCVLSPEWLASRTCQVEVAHAVVAHKRIIPLVRHDVHGLDVPPPVRAANWIFFRASDDGDAAFRQLIFAIDTDLDYWHLASRMQVRAAQWEQNRENASFTLRGKELAEAEQWLASGAEKQPSPTALQTRYITASRRTSARRQRTIITSLSTLLAIAIVLATLASIQTVRVTQQNAQLFASSLAGASSADLVNQKLGQALLLADAATRQQDTFETRNALLDALEASSHLAATVTDVVQGTPSGASASAVSFSGDGKTLMYAESGQQGRITLWDVATRRTRTHYSIGDAIYGAALSPDGTLLATLGIANGLTLRDASNGNQLAQLAPETTQEPDGSYSISNLDLEGPNIAFSHDGSRLAAVLCDSVTCAHPYIGMWNPRTRAPAGTLSLSFIPELTALAFSPDGRSVAATECKLLDTTQLCQIELWNLSGAVPAQRFQHVITPADGAPYDVEAVAFSPDGALLATTNCDTIVRLWDPATAKLLRRLSASDSPPACLRAVAFSPNGQLLAARLDDGTTGVWDLASGDLVSVCSDCAVAGDLYGISTGEIAFSPDSQLIAVPAQDANGSHVALANAKTGQVYHMFSSPGAASAQGAAFSPDGKLLAIGGGGRGTSGITLWDLAQQKAAAVLQGSNAEVGALAFTRDGRHLIALDGDGVLTVWDVTSHKTTGSLDLHSTTNSDVSLSLHPNGWLLAASSNQSIWLVDLRDLAHPQLYIHAISEPSYVHNIAFSPDGKVLAAAEDDVGVVVRLATLGAWQQQACAEANRNFSHAEWNQFFGPQGLPYTPLCPGLPVPG